MSMKFFVVSSSEPPTYLRLSQVLTETLSRRVQEVNAPFPPQKIYTNCNNCPYEQKDESLWLRYYSQTKKQSPKATHRHSWNINFGYKSDWVGSAKS